MGRDVLGGRQWRLPGRTAPGGQSDQWICESSISSLEPGCGPSGRSIRQWSHCRRFGWTLVCDAGQGARYVGASNYSAKRLREALSVSDQHGYVRYLCLQPPYNLVNRAPYEGELEALCLEQGQREPSGLMC